MNKNIIILIPLLIILIYLIIPKENENFINEFQDYVILEFYPVNQEDDGGFYWWVHNIACLFKICELNNKKPMILMNGGYYYDNNKNEKSWWDYFFDYPKVSENEYLLYKEHKNNLEPVRSMKLKKGLSYLYDMKTFQKVVRPESNDIVDYYKYVKLKPEIQKKIDEIYNKGSKGYFQLGVHYRGTDKFYGNGDQEDLLKNRHLDYGDVSKKMKEYCKKNNISNYVVYAASDELDFINHMKNAFPNCYTYEDCFRTKVNTSGHEMKDTSMCNYSNKNSKDCKEWYEFTNKSIHKGNYENISNFKKGEDAVFDVWLLSKSDVYFSTHGGNFGSHPPRINTKLKEIKLI